MKKRFLPLLMALIMTLSLLPTTAMAAPGDVTSKLGKVSMIEGRPKNFSYLRDLGPATDVKTAGDAGFFQRLPLYSSFCLKCGRAVRIVYAKNYTGTYEITGDEGVITNCEYKLAYSKFYGYESVPCLQFNYTAAKPGTATVTLTYYYNYRYSGENMTCVCGNKFPIYGQQGWFKETATFTVVVKEDGSVEEPDVPNHWDTEHDLYVPVDYSGTFEFQYADPYGNNFSLKKLEVVSENDEIASATKEITGGGETASVTIQGEKIGETAVYATYRFNYAGQTWRYTEKINVHVYEPETLEIEKDESKDVIHPVTSGSYKANEDIFDFDTLPSSAGDGKVIQLARYSNGHFYIPSNNTTALAVAYNVTGKEVGTTTVESTYGFYTGTVKHPSLHMFVDVVNVTVTEKTEEPVTEKVTITKNIAGLPDGVTLDEAATFNFTIIKQVLENGEWINAAGDPTTVSVTVPAGALSASSNALTLSVTGEKERYVVVETTPAADITAGGKTYEWKNVSISNEQFTLDKEAVSVTATNNYAEKELTPDTGSIKVVKNVSGLKAYSDDPQQYIKDHPDAFTFTVTASDGSYRSTKSAQFVGNSLEVTFSGLDISKTYTVSEDSAKASVSGYKLTTTLYPDAVAYSTQDVSLNDVTVEKDQTVTLICTNTYEEIQANTYLVRYFGNGSGSKNVPGNQTKEEGIDLTLSATKPSRNGYTFLYWNTKSDNSGKRYDPKDVYTIDANLDLYAIWSEDTTPETPDRDNDGTLVIRKTDANDGSKLTGAYFTVYKQSGSKWVEECTIRTTNGYASTGLDNGKYYVVETMAPAGYTLDETEHSFTISNNTVTLELTNDKTATPAALNDSDHFAYIIGYEDGTVQPSGNITRAEVATIFFRLLTDEVRDEYMSTSNPFSDVKSTAWYNRAVSTLYQLDILKGSNDGKFHPQDTITRAEFAAIAARFSDKKVSASTPFTDLAKHWAKDEVTAAASLGWVNGYTDGTFRPNQPITRAEAMTLVNRVLNRSPKSVDDLLDNMVKWPDNANPSKWYYLAVQEATNSHDYKASGSSESWTKLTKAPDWAALEH